MKTTALPKRFRRFTAALNEATGDRAQYTIDGRVIIARNEFSPPREFRSIQAAIDNFARYMPADLL